MATRHRKPNERGHRLGITLVELLVALFVFSIVAALAGSGIVQALRVQTVNEANASLQGKLRRITEVVSQDLRSTVLGAVIEPSDTTQVSFTIAAGGQGFDARPISGHPWPNAGVLRVFADAGSPPVAVGDRILLVNAAGRGSTVPVGGVTTIGSGRFDISLANGCTTAIGSGHPVRMFVVDAVGYELSEDGDLVRHTNGTAQPLAFALSSFQVQYAYRHQVNNTVTIYDEPMTDADGTPLRFVGPEVLESLRVRVAAEEAIFGNRTVERAYAALIAMPSPGTLNLRSVVSCP